QKDYRISHPDLSANLPLNVNLKLLSKKLEVSPCLANKILYREDKNTLYLYAREESQYLTLLRQWVKSIAKEALIPRLQFHADSMGLSYEKVFIKNQKTRWGSCSSRKNINLNQNLVFLDPQLVDYLLIHELSHLRHPNHSRQFWLHVQKYDLNYKLHDRQLNKSVVDLPLWAHLP
ncbi:MAG: M48 family metallopeptidase, partial [Gammaproteobacteria bacterium]|nr:M48 family metallopeptidase [Gammaproteobacteria bacterium]